MGFTIAAFNVHVSATSFMSMNMMLRQLMRLLQCPCPRQCPRQCPCPCPCRLLIEFTLMMAMASFIDIFLGAGARFVSVFFKERKNKNEKKRKERQISQFLSFSIFLSRKKTSTYEVFLSLLEDASFSPFFTMCLGNF